VNYLRGNNFVVYQLKVMHRYFMGEISADVSNRETFHDMLLTKELAIELCVCG